MGAGVGSGDGSARAPKLALVVVGSAAAVVGSMLGVGSTLVVASTVMVGLSLNTPPGRMSDSAEAVTPAE